MSEATKPMPKQRSVAQWSLIAVLTALVAIATLPSYISGQWPWSAELPVPHIENIRELLETPLEIDGWQSVFHEAVDIGGNRWSLTEYRSAGEPAESTQSFGLLLRPQMAGDQQPEVEWVDLRGAQSWQVDNRQTVRFTLPAAGDNTTVKARYLRGVNERTTFAAMQWYAWPKGGHFAPGRWFWHDQAKQWRQQERLPWVAVSILLPIEPVGDIRLHTETVTAIAQTVQQELMTSTFNTD
ncbi:MAG: cyanoexosortase B system-associated protein [Cyanobacteria bacterium P01_C01_bin.120]